jgi:hypothetical protein
MFQPGSNQMDPQESDWKGAQSKTQEIQERYFQIIIHT